MILTKAPVRALGSLARASAVASMSAWVILLGGACRAAQHPALAQAAPAGIGAAQDIANKFSSVKTLTGILSSSARVVIRRRHVLYRTSRVRSASTTTSRRPFASSPTASPW